MLQPLFPNKKSRKDYVIFIFGIVACLLCYTLREYWYYQPLTQELRERLTFVADSVLAEDGIRRDSVYTYLDPSVDETSLTFIKNKKGVYARKYMDTSDTQLLLVRMKLERRSTQNTIVRFSLNRSRSNANAGYTEATKDFVRVVWLNEVGGIVGATRYIHDDLPMDSTILKSYLLSIVPERYSHLSLSIQTDSSSTELIRLTAPISENDLFKKELLIALRRISTKPALWSVEWQIRVAPIQDSTSQSSDTSGVNQFIIREYLQYVFWSIAGLAIIGLFIVALQRQRLKALNIELTFLPIVTGLSIVLSQVTIGETPWLPVVLTFLSGTLGYGFFFLTVPLAAVTSVLREIVPEKFYTIKRWTYQPWNSFHWGRMILLGASFAFIYEAFSSALPFLGTKLGIDAFANMDLTQNSLILPFTMRNPLALFLHTIGNIAPLMSILCLLGFMLALRFLPRKYALWGMFLASSFLLILFAFMREGSGFGTFLRELGWAALVTFVFYYFDMLALLSLIVFEAFIFVSGMFDMTSFWSIIFYASPMLVLLEAGIAYQNTPEAVAESDYKPEFVTLIEENERLHQEIAAAKSVQQKLLPRALPTHERVSVSATCVPAYEVGGDYYDFFSLDNKRLGILIGDVSGKGISAAFYITLAKGVIVSQVRGSGTPSEVLHRVNSLLYGVMERGKFVSMIYGIYDADTQEFSFANAGHNPLVVRRKDGKIETISSKGMAIGLDKGERFEKAVTTTRISLQSEDCVLLYTDGVTEAMNVNHEEFGEARMLESIRSCPLQAAEIISRILYDVRKFAGKAHQHDDITMVALQAMT